MEKNETHPMLLQLVKKKRWKVRHVSFDPSYSSEKSRDSARGKDVKKRKRFKMRTRDERKGLRRFFQLKGKKCRKKCDKRETKTGR